MGMDITKRIKRPNLSVQPLESWFYSFMVMIESIDPIDSRSDWAIQSRKKTFGWKYFYG
jgi:hypothetical protein